MKQHDIGGTIYLLLKPEFAQAAKAEGLAALPIKLSQTIRQFGGREVDFKSIGEDVHEDNLVPPVFGFGTSRALFLNNAEKWQKRFSKGGRGLGQRGIDMWLSKAEDAPDNEFVIFFKHNDPDIENWKIRHSEFGRNLLSAEFKDVVEDVPAFDPLRLEKISQREQVRRDWQQKHTVGPDLLYTWTTPEEQLDRAIPPTNPRMRKYWEGDTHVAVFMIRRIDNDSGQEQVVETSRHVNRNGGIQKIYDELVRGELEDPGSELQELRIAALIEIGDQPRHVSPEDYDDMRAARAELDARYPGVEKRPMGVCSIPSPAAQPN